MKAERFSDIKGLSSAKDGVTERSSVKATATNVEADANNVQAKFLGELQEGRNNIQRRTEFEAKLAELKIVRDNLSSE